MFNLFIGSLIFTLISWMAWGIYVFILGNDTPADPVNKGLEICMFSGLFLSFLFLLLLVLTVK